MDMSKLAEPSVPLEKRLISVERLKISDLSLSLKVKRELLDQKR
jgi:hypothetical protein